MPYDPFKNICEYYLDYIIEDSTDTISAFASGFSLSYLELRNPELSSREVLELNPNEQNSFNELYRRQNRGNQRRTYWYGYPTIIKFITSKNNWQGGIIKPLFILPLEIENGNAILLPNTPRINNDAFRDLDLDLEHIRGLAENIGLYDEGNANISLNELSERLINRFPNFNIINFENGQALSTLPFINETRIYSSGVIIGAEASNFSQGLEKELNLIKSISAEQIKRSSLLSFFRELDNDITGNNNQEFNLSEAIELNEQQRETVVSAFENKLTVVTGPPGTGKSQVVASIVINAAKNGERVLVASKNHKAVDVVEDRLNQFANRPFIIRLGRRGSNDRNIQQELIQYLNGILGTAANNQTNQELQVLQKELTELHTKRRAIINQIEEYRVYRNSLNHYSAIWVETQQKIGNDKAKEIYDKCLNRESSFFSKIHLLFSKNWKNIQTYKNLLKADHKRDLEILTTKLTEIELEIRNKSKKEFVLWLNDLPSRIDGNRREVIGNFVSILEQIINAGNDTPRNVWAQLFRNRDNLMQQLSGFLPAWCVTNLATRGQLPLIEGFFDIVIIDEASQCDIVSALPLLYRAKRIVIIGDPNQFTHISTLNTGRSLSLMQRYNLNDVQYSVFEATQNSLYRLGAARIGNNKIINLNEHFRSHENIITYSNNTWYGGNLLIGTDYNYLKPQPVEGEPTIEWLNIVGNIQQVDSSGAYITNEVDAVVQKVIEINENIGTGATIGIVTPFRLQANKIREALLQHLTPNVWTDRNLLVHTAVKFQGDERDVIIFSPVVTANMPRGIRYYHESNSNLVNVSITRARARLIVIGNLNACLNCGITYIQNFANYVINLQHQQPILQAGGQFESNFEETLYNALLTKGIRTMPQYQFDQYRLDLAYVNNKKIDIEVDGVTYHTDITGERIKQDIIRNRRLQKKGWTVLRFWSYEIRDNIDYCTNKIIQEINRRG